MYTGLLIQDWILRSLNVILGKNLHPIISNSKSEVALLLTNAQHFLLVNLSERQPNLTDKSAQGSEPVKRRVKFITLLHMEN